jgi:hypothetical protein
MKNLNIPKYIERLKQAKVPFYVVNHENSLALKDLKHPGNNNITIALNLHKPYPKDLQIAEVYSRMKEDHQYMNDTYKHLLTSLKDIDKSYSISKATDQRVVLAKNAISAWDDFVQRESEALPGEEFFVSDDTKFKLREIWDRFKVI